MMRCLGIPLLPLGSLLVMMLALAGCQGEISGSRDAQPASSLDQQLEELNQAAPPTGVEADTWATLTRELARVLAERGSLRQSSAAPVSDDAATTLIIQRSGSEATLIWGHVLPGDYDQNGLVNISDLTPLGVHFQKSSPGGFSLESIESVVDGDGNGEINLADVTPIGQHFLENVEAYELYESQDFSDYPDSNGEEPALTAIQTVPLGDFSGDAATQPLYHITQSFTPDLNAIYWVRPLGDGQSGTSSNRIFGSSPPEVLSITVSPDPVPSGSNALVHVAVAPGSNGGSPSIAWQLDGEGSIDPFGETVNFTAPSVGSDDHVTLRVALSDGQHEVFAERSVVIWAGSSERWHSSIVDNTDVTGTHNTLYSALGGPLLAYSNQGSAISDELLAANASGFAGADWNIAAQNDPAGSFQDMSGALINGFPGVAVSYSGGVAFSLHSFGSFSPFLPLPGAPFSCYANSIAQIQGQPAVAFQGASGADFEIMYSRAIDYQTSNWNTPVTAAGSPNGSVGSFLSMVELSGRPAICYLDQSSETWTLRYAVATDSSGSGWEDYLAYQHPFSSATGRHCSMDVVDGRPAIAFLVNNSGLYYIRADDSLGQSWPAEAVHLDDGGEGLDLHVVGFQPAIAYEWRSGNAVDSHLRYIRAQDAQGSAWSEPEIADGELNSLLVGSSINPTLKEIEGRPAISYYDPVNSALKYAVKY